MHAKLATKFTFFQLPELNSGPEHFCLAQDEVIID